MYFIKNDRVYFFFGEKCKKIHGHIWRRYRDLYAVIDDAGKEWLMYPEELRHAQTFSPKELNHGS